jgi:acetyltransferase
MADYRALRTAFLKPIEIVSAPPTSARAAARAGLAATDRVLCEWEARPVLAAYGIGTLPTARLVDSAAAAAAAAAAIGGPVALKIQSPDILHKTEAGGVRLNLANPDVGPAYTCLIAATKRHAPTARVRGVLVQAMAPPGLEMILGIKRDATFGPLLLVGLGGVNVERFKDVVLAPVPLTADAARGLLQRLQGANLLKAYRGSPPCDVDALVDAMVRLAALGHDFADEITDIDLNPVVVHAEGGGLSVVDALLVKGQA